MKVLKEANTMAQISLIFVLVIVGLFSIVLDRRYVRGKRTERELHAKMSGNEK